VSEDLQRRKNQLERHQCGADQKPSNNDSVNRYSKESFINLLERDGLIFVNIVHTSSVGGVCLIGILSFGWAAKTTITYLSSNYIRLSQKKKKKIIFKACLN
jgi:hypothetical protein